MLKALGRESFTWSTLPERIELLTKGKLIHSRTGNMPGGMLALKIKVRKEGRGEEDGSSVLNCFTILSSEDLRAVPLDDMIIAS